MKYDFDHAPDRKGTASYKWDQSEKLFGHEDVLPLWVADMDFAPPKEVVDEIVRRAQLGVYGYTFRTPEYAEAVSGWLKRRHGWEIQHDWISQSSPGVVTALSMSIYTFTEPGDKVILQAPVYYPFYDVIKMHGREVVENTLVLREGRYEVDFDLLEQQAADGAKLLLLCSPHNPGGRVWTREELTRIGDICVRHGVLVVADEIHHDLVLRGHKHTPFASIKEEFAQISLTCIATSKTFNLAGLQSACVIIPNAELRRRYNQALKTFSVHMESYFGLTAIVSAYTYGDEWLEQLLDYLEGNLDYMTQFLAEKLPEIKVIRPEATYLVWMDCSAISKDPADLKKLMYDEARVAFNEGSVYGKPGAGYLRVNIACPRSILIEALERFTRAVRSRR
ncbi:pyridoxal phosphate-dependent aminotransferase [Cohnella pontilimi]|uniref:cysteine-S-conjugate beta-lyase n=1 Tax=Cohnella pontilimi TaxID=2564100 RepID=A0A4U0FCM7_9BACL|nr:MalY/PatB family protein [Cohnella pontilimi]TJY41032.1 pyridoxal phosphate-dependent aminotransferase [Cohnella pontilimi]